MEKIVVQFDFPGLTSEQYDQIWKDMHASGNSHPDGLISHIGAPTDRGWMAIDIWESAAKFDRFKETLTSIVTKNGVEKVDPVISPIHYMFGED